MGLSDRGARFRFLLRDWAGQFTALFDAVLADAGITVVRFLPKSRATADAERFVLTVQTEVTDRMLILGEGHLRTALTEYLRHYNRRRPRTARSTSTRHGLIARASLPNRTGSNADLSSAVRSTNTNQPPKRPHQPDGQFRYPTRLEELYTAFKLEMVYDADARTIEDDPGSRHKPCHRYPYGQMRAHAAGFKSEGTCTLTTRLLLGDGM
jgi:hypothetical protein